MTSLEHPGAPTQCGSFWFGLQWSHNNLTQKLLISILESLDFPPIWSRALLLVSANSANGCAGAKSEGAPREHVLSSVDGQNGSKRMVWKWGLPKSNRLSSWFMIFLMNLQVRWLVWGAYAACPFSSDGHHHGFPSAWLSPAFTHYTPGSWPCQPVSTHCHLWIVFLSQPLFFHSSIFVGYT